MAIPASLDNALLYKFSQTFDHILAQTDSKLLQSGAMTFMPSDGTNVSVRMGNVELAATTGRNPNKDIATVAIDSRIPNKYPLTKTIRVDKFDKNFDFITDPTGDFTLILQQALKRALDRQAILTAVGSVYCIDTTNPIGTATAVSAADDGVITIDGTADFNYEDIVTVAIQNFANADVERTENTIFCMSGAEQRALMLDDSYKSMFYTSANRPVDTGYISNVSGYKPVIFAGSVTGGIVKPNPVLPESGTTRTNVVIAPNALKLAFEAQVDITEPTDKARSLDITINGYLKILRTQGALVQLISSTF